MTPKFPGDICAKTVAKNHNAVSCDICNLWAHTKCNSKKKLLQKTSTESRTIVLSKMHKASITFFKIYL